MTPPLRATPCVGICSTTYGDLVCRGCKRFAHEIVGWNTYSDEQRATVWHRLRQLRDESTASFVAVENDALWQAAVAELRLAEAASASSFSLSYELLRRRARDVASLNSIGLRAIRDTLRNPVAVRDAIDAEFLVRSKAYFEHSFHIPVDH
jgi:predicted Fe-S protein YdhL (DUF1289 family)